MMARQPAPPAHKSVDLSVPERVLLFCVASGTDWQRAGVTGDIVTLLVVKGLLSRDAAGALSLSKDGRAALDELVKAST